MGSYVQDVQAMSVVVFVLQARSCLVNLENRNYVPSFQDSMAQSLNDSPLFGTCLLCQTVSRVKFRTLSVKPTLPSAALKVKVPKQVWELLLRRQGIPCWLAGTFLSWQLLKHYGDARRLVLTHMVTMGPYNFSQPEYLLGQLH